VQAEGGGLGRLVGPLLLGIWSYEDMAEGISCPV
jgi:hypothetical protein